MLFVQINIGQIKIGKTLEKKIFQQMVRSATSILSYTHTFKSLYYLIIFAERTIFAFYYILPLLLKTVCFN